MNSFKISFLFLMLIGALNSECFFNSNWELIIAEGLPTKNLDVSDMVFINDTTGLIGGASWKDKNFINNRFDLNQAVIFETNNGGESWDKVVIDKGEVKKVLFVNGTFLSIVNQYSNDLVLEKSKLYKSDYKKKKWSLMYEFDSYIKNIVTYDGTLIAIGRDLESNEGFWTIYQSSKSLDNWRVIGEVESIIEPVIYDNKLFFIDISTGSEALYAIDLITTRKKRIETGGITIKKLSVSNNLYFLGEKDDAIVFGVYEREGMKIINKFSEYKSSYVFEFSVCESQVGILIGKITGSFTTKEFLYSEDYGKTLVKENFKISNLVKHINLLNNGMAWVYSGGNRLQKRPSSIKK